MKILTPAELQALSPEDLAKYISDLEGALTAEQDAHEQTKADAEKEVGALSAQLAIATKAAVQGYTAVQSGDKTYRVIGKSFNLRHENYGDNKGRIISLEELVKDQAIIDAMVALGSGCMAEVAD